ncbi:uncharacterized protein OCT59_026139 [Rhizophagus irregularis]|nr:hypothetical protein OCT59_026139 [Rhizophagus irregularis]
MLGKCRIPAPFIMSRDRRACVNHQPQFFKEQIFHNIKPKPEHNDKDITPDFTNSKTSHANLLYFRWLAGRPKHIFSKRMGISFISSYHAQDNVSVLKFHNKHMYRKRLSNFEKIPSPNLRTRKKQEIRFNRACRRIFNKMKLPPGRTAQHSDYLAMGRKYRFLFVKSQYINKPIKHLLYKKDNIAPNADNYQFFIPFYINNSQHATTIKANVNHLGARIHISSTLLSFDNLIPWVEEYNPIPNMFIPLKYRDIIPKEPIYILTEEGDTYIPPGSRQWFTYMYNLEKRIRRQQRFDEQDRQLQAEALAEWNLREQNNNARAAYYGTSRKHLGSRLRGPMILTTVTNCYDEYIRRHIKDKNHPDHINNERKQRNLNKNLSKFLKQFTFNSLTRQDDLSDDTKILEHRPNKHDSTRFTNTISNNLSHPNKRPRPSTDTLDNSTVAGPSTNSEKFFIHM